MYHIGDNLQVDKNLTVEGNSNLDGSLAVNGNETVQGTVVVQQTVTSTGSMFAPAFVQTSDYRLKQNVKPIESIEALKKISQLNPITYDKKVNFESGWMKEAGFLAHEVQAVIPDAVYGEKNGIDFQYLNTIMIIPYLVATIQQLNKRIEELEKQNASKQ